MLISPVEKHRLSSLQSSVKHRHGPKHIATGPDEAIVLCVVKDGKTLIHAFIEHYKQLGFKHIFFLDNGSTDGTVGIIKTYDQTTVVSSNKPFEQYYVTFKNFLIQTFGQNAWCVVADVDEFLYFSYSQRLSDVLTYLHQRSYNTVCVQMLDMFSKAGIALSEHRNVWTLDGLKSAFNYYDLSDVDQRKYVCRFRCRTHPGLNFLYGGIRKTVFGRDCFLTKEVLFRAHKGTRLKTSHLLKSARLADFSAVFLHYKFTEDFYAYTVNAVAQENHWRNSHEYKAYLSVLEQNKEQAIFPMLQPSSLALESIDELVNHHFLFASDEFRLSACKR